MPSFSADAFIGGYFTIDAWVLADRWKHHRTRDHWGAESDLYIVLSSSIGKYAEGTPVHYVLEDMLYRIQQVEDNNRVWGDFALDAWLAVSGTYGQGVIDFDAVIKGTLIGDDYRFTADADIIAGTFTVDARVTPSFTISAFVI
jgi:hypothetical protein